MFSNLKNLDKTIYTRMLPRNKITVLHLRVPNMVLQVGSTCLWLVIYIE